MFKTIALYASCSAVGFATPDIAEKSGSWFIAIAVAVVVYFVVNVLYAILMKLEE